MAPEQLRGESATARSDLFSLGLVLYEMVVGRPRFEAGTVAHVLSQHETSRPEETMGRLADVDPELGRVIDWCMRARPRDRPSSIEAVQAALPGGDPLQVALEAGETPSPELVASARGRGELRPSVVAMLLVAFIALVLVSTLAASRWGQVPGYIEVPEPPEALATRAGDLLAQAGVATREGDVALGWEFDWDRRIWIVQHGFEWQGRGRGMAPSPVYLWYRFGPQPLEPRSQLARVTPEDPPLDRTGMARVRLDAQGRLLELIVVPPERSPLFFEPEPGWTELLEATGVDQDSLRDVEPEWTPPVAAQRRRAWTAVYPGQPDLPVRVEAATVVGQPVWLQVIPPWMAAGETALREGTMSHRLWTVAAVAKGLLFLLLVGTAALLARRNVRRGRGDSKGAFRLGLFVGSTTFITLVLRADFAPEESLGQIIQLFGFGIAEGFVAWIAYLAMEPYLRRSWPHILIGWHRFVAGRIRDARVGREVLLGLVAGLLLAAIQSELAVQMRLGDFPYPAPLHLVTSPRDLFASLIGALSEACINPLFGGLVLLVATVLLRRRTWAIAGLWTATFLIAGGEEFYFDLQYALALMFLLATFWTLVLVRVGLLGFAVMTLAGLLIDFPLTLDSSAWYFPHSLIPLVALLAVGVWAAWRSLGRRADLSRLLGDEMTPS
jgi:hypothetical protein